MRVQISSASGIRSSGSPVRGLEANSTTRSGVPANCSPGNSTSITSPRIDGTWAAEQAGEEKAGEEKAGGAAGNSKTEQPTKSETK